MPAAKKKETTDPRGLKRICAACGARFYDMNKRPIICPSCETEFTGEIKVKTRRGRFAAASEGQVEEKKAEVANDGEVEEEDTADVDVVSLDDAAADEAKSDDESEEEAPDAELDLDALEDGEGEDDDLSGLEGDVDLSVESEKE